MSEQSKCVHVLDALAKWLPPANEVELVRMERREQIGQKWGLTAHDAGRVADVLHLRDRAKDDRRLCAECLHLRKKKDGDVWGCAAGVSPARAGGDALALDQRAVFFETRRCASFERNAAWPEAA